MGQGGEAAKGAIGGAMTGAAVGSIIPGVGTLIGAGAGGLIGGIGGYFSGGKENENDTKYRQMLMDYYNSLGSRVAPQMGGASQAGYSSFRTNQSGLIQRLEGQMNGQGPSLAAQQYRQATDQNLSAQNAMAATGRGGNMGAFNAANNMGMLGAQAAQGSAMARTQEEMNAQNQLGLTLYGARGADEETNRFNSGEQNKVGMANLDARLKYMNIDDNTRLQILNQLGGQNKDINGRVTFGDQMLAGGAGMMGSYIGAKGKGG